MAKDNNQPIGIFDSGVGGLTVASAVKRALPNEGLIYFGDTAHLPYGDKSRETVITYSVRITRFLMDQGCKVIVVACNTASANALEAIQEEAGGHALVVDVINPVVDHVTSDPSCTHIGIIGTKGTINSGSYENKIKARNPGLSVSSLATPMLVPMIEEGFIFDDISNAIIRTYLSKPGLEDINALILGCTHYPVIRNQISKFYNFSLEVIDSSKIVAAYLRDLLIREDLMNTMQHPGQNGQIEITKHRFYVSDYTDYFQVISKLFFEEVIRLEKKNLW